MDVVSEDLRLADRLLVVTRPRPGGRWPGVVMIHEIFGVDDVLRRQASRLASAGYVVHCPDLRGDGPRLRCLRALFRSLRERSGRPFELIDAARRRLADDPHCTGQVGVIGFCIGGGFALLTAGSGFGAASVNYGQIPDDVDDVLVGSCPLVASYGGRDPLSREVPRLTAALDRAGVPADVKVYPAAGHSFLTAALDRAGVPADVKVYPAAGHSFLNDAPNGPRLLRPLMKVAPVGPEPASAADAWRRIEAFFAEHLQPEPDAPAS